MRPYRRLLHFSGILFFLSGFVLMSRVHLEFISENMMYPNRNLYLLLLSTFFCGGFIFYSRRKIKKSLILGFLALLVGQASVIPFSELDQLFYGQLQKIDDGASGRLLADKIELCEHIKSNYENLKPRMLLELDRVCSEKVLKLSQRSKADLSLAFDWAYSEYVRRPQSFQIMALACLYAETNQQEFAVQLVEKHNFENLKNALLASGRCPIFGKRQIASVKEN